MSTIIAFSDVHLGWDKSDSETFLAFLHELQGRSDLSDVVVIGDFVDLWRRDVVGLEFELSRYMEELKALKQKANVHYVFGNHDFHVGTLKNHEYPFTFERFVPIEKFGYKIIFAHGDQCDPIQNDHFSEFLCWTLSDDIGKWKSKFWDIFGPLMNEQTKTKLTKEEFEAKLDSIMSPPEEKRRREAFGKPVDYVRCLKKWLGVSGENEFIVFGHTHQAFIDLAERVANTGCWIKGVNPTNTYFELGDSWPPVVLEYKGSKLPPASISTLKF
jgi:UDP-2,3-diacylglucosamine pyrophosphatase LpxH